MNWIVATILMILSSVALYLCVRKASLLKIPSPLTNLAMFLIPALAYLAMGVMSETSLQVTPLVFLYILGQSIFFSYLGNKLSLKGIEYAPNPGYSLIISKSYVVMTSLASVFLFQAPLTLKSIIAIGLIVAFSCLIMIEKKVEHAETKPDSRWLAYTIGAFLCWGFLALSTKYLLNLGVPLLVRLIYTMPIVSLLIGGEVISKKVSFKEINRTQLLVLGIIGITGTTFNYYMQLGFSLAPNVGFINAANTASIAVLTPLSALIFKDELSPKKVLGVIGVASGLLLLFL